MYGSRKSVNGSKMVTNTGMKVPVKNTFSKNCGRVPKEYGKYPYELTDSFLYGNRSITISRGRDLNDHLFMVRIKKLFKSSYGTFEPQFSLN